MKLVVANWKMNPSSGSDAERIVSGILGRLKGLSDARLVICPPFPFLGEVAGRIARTKNAFLGAQDASAREGAAHTGEVSPAMLKNAGAAYVIVGHSERRASGDTDEIVRAKLLAVLRAGLKAILCVGERKRDREGNHFAEVEGELKSALAGLPKKFAKNVIVAYEPVWAIGKSERQAMKGADLREMVIFIRRVLSDILKTKEIGKFVILYGGSATHGNAERLVAEGGVSGLLVGRESLKPNDFARLVREIAS